jgi:hypothetical protein
VWFGPHFTGGGCFDERNAVLALVSPTAVEGSGIKLNVRGQDTAN